MTPWSTDVIIYSCWISDFQHWLAWTILRLVQETPFFPGKKHASEMNDYKTVPPLQESFFSVFKLENHNFSSKFLQK